MERQLGKSTLEDDARRLRTWLLDEAGGPIHNILSATHPDTIAGTVTRGDLIVGESTPKWGELAVGPAGWVVGTADGADVTYLDPTLTLPLAPVAQGDLIIADATPAWSILTLGAGAGYALVSTATTAAWDQTPTWTGKHTFTAPSAIEIDLASGDPVIIFDTQGADKFTIGVDDSDSDKFKINSGSSLIDPSDFELDSSGNAEIGGDFNLLTGKGIIHADGVTAGYVLRADGTRYVPADPTLTVPLAPVAQGDLIIADATPAWSILTLGAAAGYALISTATTAAWDQTPTWTGTHTFTAASAIEIDLASGDPVIIFDTQGADKFTVGVDDSDSDKFKVNSGGSLADPSSFELDSSGNVEIGGDFNLLTGKGIIHADGVTAGYVLRADGTRYIPADPTTTLPLAPVAQGDLIIADGTPAWSILTLGAAAGYALVSTATTAAWDQTPVWTGTHTFTAASAIEIDLASGDPVIIFDTQAADKFTIGVDDSDGDQFKISGGGTLGASDWISVAADGDIGIRCTAAAANFEIEDGGTGNTVLLKVTQDDANTWGMVIGNDASSTTDTHGLGLTCRGGGTAYIWAQSTTAEDLILQPGGFSNGNVGIGLSDIALPTARLHISGIDGANLPVLQLEQHDVSDEFIRFVAIADAGDLTRPIVDEGDQASETREGWLWIYVNDGGNQVADGYYHIPFYSLSA